jgi:hypothetical protein
MSILTYIAGWPLLAALLLIFVPGNYRVIIRAIAVLATFISMVLAIKMFIQFTAAPVDADGYRFVQQIPWVESLGISYHVGVDGINVGLILMGAIVAFAATLCSWEIQKREKEFYILLLIMAGGILGAFASLDLFFFYFLHELALVPTFIMIGVWGRGEKKNYATFQITLYLTIGALIALIGLIALYLQSGANTFDIPKIIAYAKTNPLTTNVQNFIFPLLLFGFGILVSLWPFHSWAPFGMSGDAFHVTAPPENGEGARKSMANALADAKLDPDRVQYVNAHATSTELGDRAETTAIHRAFGAAAKQLAVSSTKSMTGHLLGAAGAVEAIFCVLALRDQIAPPTINLDQPGEGCDLDYVPKEARQMKLDTALSNSFGFGGTNGSLIFRRI